MHGDRTVERKIADAVNKVNRGLVAYFEKTVASTCAKIKKVDENWLRLMVDEITREFLQNTERDVSTILKNYAVNEKVTTLEYANRNLHSSRVWYPSGDPDKDVRAQLLAVDRAHLKQLSERVLTLHGEVRPILNEVQRQQCRLRSEFHEVQLCAKQISEARLEPSCFVSWK
ncbi:unnamed protein product [Dicrocoelium dendriticum]|nr:unnamed protein product [Dicrocoelium dendriticum]